MSQRSLETSLDDIIRQLKKYQWISSYEIFLQTQEIMTGTITKNHKISTEYNLNKKMISGVAVRIISKNRKLKEVAFSITSLNKLISLDEPKSTIKNQNIPKLKSIKTPNIVSIPGDDARANDLNSEIIKSFFDKITYFDDRGVVSDNHTITLQKEYILITNSSSIPINFVSLKCHYGINSKMRANNVELSVNRSEYGRSPRFDFNNIIEDNHENLKRRNQKIQQIDQNIKSLIIHPDVIGRIILYQSFAYDTIYYKKNKIWNDDFYLYDDPLRDGGFNSALFDDEGSMTKSKLIIENGIQTGRLDDINSGIGGNGYRVSWFQPLNRSYQYPLIRNVSNLVFTGGTGQGKLFIQRRGKTLLILKGQGFIGGMANNPHFVIHTSEVEMWDNGTYVGPTQNITISGSINHIMSEGDVSADQHQVVDNAVPGAVYIGWLRISPNEVIINI